MKGHDQPVHLLSEAADVSLAAAKRILDKLRKEDREREREL